jgi:tRNA A-37 threonylcarbamoyl transferase component Bud32
MKRCPRCNARFDDGLLRCPHDAATLVDVGDPMLGRTLADRYRLVHRIGAGGMGTVYRAQHLLLRRDVALKLLAPELTRDPVMRERFLREAQATHMLRHPNIVEVYDVAVDGSRVFLVMELLEGDCLASWVGGGPMDVQLALRVVRPVVAALARAHAHGVVHRDIKPENIFVARRAAAPPEDMVVKVLDFGIAHLRHEARLTAPGEVFGTPEYLAPELARGEACQPASDLYAVGVMLFELVTGSLPFDGDLAHIVAQHRDAPPPSARARNPAVPAALDALIVRLMDKDPAARPECAAVLGRLLDGLLAGGDPGASGVRVREVAPTMPSSLAEDDDERKTVPRALPTPPSLATLRQHQATFEAAVAAAHPDGAPEWVVETLRSLNAAMKALDAVESQRRGAVREMSERARVAQEQREVLLDALAEAARAQSVAEARSAGLVAQCAEAAAHEQAARHRVVQRWQAVGAPGEARGLDDAIGAQLEALGAEAAAWRAAAAALSVVTAERAAAEQQTRTRLRALAEARDALEAHEEATRQADEASRADSAHTGIEIDTLYGFVQESAGMLARHLRDVPAARGILTSLAPLPRSA